MDGSFPINDVFARRSILAPGTNPERRLDYAVTLTGRIKTIHATDAAFVSIQYVPDALTVSAKNLEAYFAALSGMDWTSLEQLAAAVMADFYDETVARWVQVTITAGFGDTARHQVTLVDRQPDWDNPALLNRIE